MRRRVNTSPAPDGLPHGNDGWGAKAVLDTDKILAAV